MRKELYVGMNSNCSLFCNHCFPVLTSRKTEKIYSGFYMPVLQTFENDYHHLLVFYFFSSFFNNPFSFDSVSRQLTILVIFLRSLSTHLSSAGFSKIKHLPGTIHSQIFNKSEGGVVSLPMEARKAELGSGIK